MSVSRNLAMDAFQSRHTAEGRDSLDGELAALFTSVCDKRNHGSVARPGNWVLTARTLSSDVLPAFCSPIMVMSISVALRDTSKSWSAMHNIEPVSLHRGRVEARGDERPSRLGGPKAGGHDDVMRANSPKQAQQPIVDASEKSSHGEVEGLEGQSFLLGEMVGSCRCKWQQCRCRSGMLRCGRARRWWEREDEGDV